MARPLFVQDCGIVTALGRGHQATLDGLAAADRHTLTPCADLLPGRTVTVGAVTCPLPMPGPALADLDCRNNRLMLAALEDIRPSVAAAAARYGRHRIAVVLGTSTAGIAEGEVALAAFRATGAWPEQFHYRQQETGGLGTFAARALGLAGPAYTIATACSSSAKAFASARRLIRAGLADAAVVGGADTLCRMTLNGFAALQALSRDKCNPFSANRDGITIGEGAAAFLLTPEEAPVQLLGVGETSDAYHPTAPDPAGGGATLAMRHALADAGLMQDDIAYINLHGTGTPLNDAMESRSIAAVFGANVPCSSTKAMTGHMLGATGGCEAAFLWLMLHRVQAAATLPAHVWDGVADAALPRINLIGPGVAVPHTRLAMLSNSFGFGGSNAALILGRGWA
jgi:3-oxoacyl-[acyl-carrier-protein] synthase-1